MSQKMCKFEETIFRFNFKMYRLVKQLIQCRTCAVYPVHFWRWLYVYEKLAVDATVSEIGQAMRQVYCAGSLARRNSNKMTRLLKHISHYDVDSFLFGLFTNAYCYTRFRTGCDRVYISSFYLQKRRGLQQSLKEEKMTSKMY